MSRPLLHARTTATLTSEIRISGSGRHAVPPSLEDFARDSDRAPLVYTLTHLPPPGLISKVLNSFYACSGTLFYLISREQSFDLFRAVYWSSSTRTKAALGELCAIAAVGGHYDSDGCSAEHLNAFFATAKVFSTDVAQLSEMRAMRVYALFTMFSIMEKRIAAWRYVCKYPLFSRRVSCVFSSVRRELVCARADTVVVIIAMGLKIAQRYGLHLKEDQGFFTGSDRIQWRKNWRTLKFFERYLRPRAARFPVVWWLTLASWLAGTLGCIPTSDYNIDSEEIFDVTVCCRENGNGSGTTVMGVDIDVVQTELGKIGFLMCDIMRNIYAAEVCSIRSIEVHMQKLERWHQELPPYMQLKTLVGSAAGRNTSRSILLVHLTYLGSIILLTRKMVVELVTTPNGIPRIVEGSEEEAQHFLDVCVGAARHVAKIVGILHSDGVIFRRCWLIMYAPLQKNLSPQYLCQQYSVETSLSTL
jgi:hypothetical protein